MGISDDEFWSLTMAELNALANANRARWSMLDTLIASVSHWIYVAAPFKDKGKSKVKDFKLLDD